MPARRPLAVVAAALALASAPGCSKRPEAVDVTTTRDPLTPREKCRVAFAACAPSANFPASTDVSALDVRTLVQIASRLDVSDRLAAAAASRLVKIASAADEVTLLEMQDAIENAAFTFGRCKCEGFPPEIEKQGVATYVSGRAPPRELRTPEYWADRMLKELQPLNALARRSAQAVLGGDAAGEDVDAVRRDAERSLCLTVHAARGALTPGAFDEAVDLVYGKLALSAGEGSAEVARATVMKQAAAPSCGAPPR